MMTRLFILEHAILTYYLLATVGPGPTMLDFINWNIIIQELVW